MLHQLQKIIGLVALASGICGIVCFCVWLGDTDWLMGHTYGSATSIIAAFWTASVGLIGTGICLMLAMLTKPDVDGDVRENDTRWLVRQRYALALLLVPVGIVAAISLSELPRARQLLNAKRIRAGEASVDELIAVLRTPRPNLDFAGTHNAAIEELGRRGPQSKEAVPVLAGLLTEPASTRMVAKTLAAIGPDAQEAIPALADVIKREQGKGSGVGGDGPSTTSSLAGEALAKIGESSVPELIRLLAHEDRYVRICAARTLGNMRSKANNAVPALNVALITKDETVCRYVRGALEKIEPQRADVQLRPIVPKDKDATQETVSSSWTTRPPYAGDPGDRPRGTVCINFADGYTWLIPGRVSKWERRVEGDQKIQAVISDTLRYEHVLGTQEVRIIDPLAEPAKNGGLDAPQDHGTTSDSKE